jgi:uncharacterized protein (DUF488 family)
MIFTIGYEVLRTTKAIRAAIDHAAAKEGVTYIIVDVRSYPDSSYMNMEVLRKEFGGLYVHMANLGNPGRTLPWKAPNQDAARRQCQLLAKRLMEDDSRSIVLLCQEAHSIRCHRREVAEMIQGFAPDLEIHHL